MRSDTLTAGRRRASLDLTIGSDIVNEHASRRRGTSAVAGRAAGALPRPHAGASGAGADVARRSGLRAAERRHPCDMTDIGRRTRRAALERCVRIVTGDTRDRRSPHPTHWLDCKRNGCERSAWRSARSRASRPSRSRDTRRQKSTASIGGTRRVTIAVNPSRRGCPLASACARPGSVTPSQVTPNGLRDKAVAHRQTAV